MSNDIGRNDPCPCGSGKKYKKCCESQNHFVTRFGPIFKEDEVLSILISQSQRFKDFYDEIKKEIKKPYYWVLDKNLPSVIYAAFTIIDEDNKCIRIKEIPASAQYEAIIAHELLHVLFAEKGYPRIRCNSEAFNKLVNILTSIFEDVLVDKRLAEQGFDISEIYKTELEDTKKQLSIISACDEMQKTILILNYLGKLLEFKYIFSENNVNYDDFMNYFEKLFSTIALESKKLLTEIEIIGFDSPENITRLFEIIINKYELKDLTTITTFKV